MILDNSLTDRESQAHASRFLCSKERLKNLLEVRVANAVPGVRHNYHNLRMLTVMLHGLHFNRKRTAFRHGINRVQTEIYQNLFQLPSIAVDHW